MTLTNLTFGDGTNKALLCGLRGFMRALVAQLHSPNEDLTQVGYRFVKVFFPVLPGKHMLSIRHLETIFLRKLRI